MSCASFRERILHFAAGGHTDPLLAAHLETCADCRESLAARRSALGAIDRVLTDELREEPSPLLAAQVRQKIETMRVRSSWATSWMPVAAAVVVLVLVLAVRYVSFTRDSSEPPRIAGPTEGPGNPPTVAHAPPPPADRTIDVSRVPTAARNTANAVPRRAGRVVAARAAAGAPVFPPVIIPKGELRAALVFSRSSARHPLNKAVTYPAGPKDEHRLEPMAALTIEKIEILPLVFKPIEVSAPEPAKPVSL